MNERRDFLGKLVGGIVALVAMKRLPPPALIEDFSTYGTDLKKWQFEVDHVGYPKNRWHFEVPKQCGWHLEEAWDVRGKPKLLSRRINGRLVSMPTPWEPTP